MGLYLYLSSTISASAIPASLTGIQVIVFLLLGYTLGHCLQPLTGFLVKRVENRYGHEGIYADKKRDPTTRAASLNKVTKAHAEANSMLALGIASVLNIVYFWPSAKLNKCFAFGAALYFVLAAVERTWARDRKILDL